MKNILVIGEKSSQIKKFKDVLLQNSKSNQEASRVYSYHGIWNGNLGIYNVKMIPLTGHISKIDTPNEYGWGKVEPLEIVKDPKALIFKDDYKYKKILKANANFDELYIATDPDSEGDNIGWEAYKILIKANLKFKTHVKRVWNTSLTDSEIKRAFAQTESNPLGWDTKLALSVQGRQIADAWLGFAGTREITRSARKVQRIKVFSVGRVQLPTLKMIVDRDKDHESFIPKPLWNLQTELKTINKEIFIAFHNKNPFVNEEDINLLEQKLKLIKQGIILRVDRNRINRKPPAPLNTTSALSLLARRFKLKAIRGLSVLSDLYLEGLLSYPRTENARFNDNFPHKDILSKLKTDNVYDNLLTKIGSSTNQVRTNGRKKGVEDHDPIHPTGELPKLSGKITKLHLDVLGALTKYYIGMFMKDLVIDKVKVDINIHEEIFIAEGKTVILEGWTEAITWQKTKDEVLPKLNVNEQVLIQQIIKIKSQTKPKPRYSDAIILKQMERLGLGTKSSRPSILEKLVDRGYILRNKTQIISQSSGRALIQVLDPIWPDIVTNTFTKNVEAKMDEVARGNTTYQAMLDQLREQYIQQHKLLINNLSVFELTLKKINPSLFDPNTSSPKRNISKTIIKKNSEEQTEKKCPSCGKGQIVERKNKSNSNTFLACSDYPNCKWTQSIITKKDKIIKNDKINTKNTNNSIKSYEKTICPRCKIGTLIVKTNKIKKNVPFLGCSTFPTCRYTMIMK